MDFKVVWTEPDLDDLREIVYRKYRIFYRVNEEGKLVEILTIWDGSRGPPTIPV